MTNIPSYEQHKVREFEQQRIMIKELFFTLKEKITLDTRNLFDRVLIQTKTNSSPLQKNRSLLKENYSKDDKIQEIELMKMHDDAKALEELTQNMLECQKLHEQLKKIHPTSEYQQNN